MVPNGPRCVFGSVLEFAASDIQKIIDSTTTFEYHRMKYLICSKSSAVVRHAFCYTCKRVRDYPWSYCPVAGSPCTDFSSFGSMLGGNGKTIAAFLVWASLMMKVLPFCLILENVARFPPRLLYELFGRQYTIETGVFCNTTLGSGVRRTRRYSILCLKTAVKLNRSILSLPRLFARERRGHSWHDYFNASVGELRAELRWGYQRTRCSDKLDHETNFNKSHFLKCLIDSELSRRQQFLDEHGASNLVIALGQEPDFSPVMSTPDLLHCLIKHNHIQWSEHHGRFMTARECLQAQGYPMTSQQLAAFQPGVPEDKLEPVSSFNISRTASGFSGRNRLNMTSQSGNAMTVSMIGAVLQFVLAFLVRVQPEEREAPEGTQLVPVPPGEAPGAPGRRLLDPALSSGLGPLALFMQEMGTLEISPVADTPAKHRLRGKQPLGASPSSPSLLSALSPSPSGGSSSTAAASAPRSASTLLSMFAAET